MTALAGLVVVTVGATVVTILAWWIIAGTHGLGTAIRYRVAKRRDRRNGVVNAMCPVAGCRTWVEGTDGVRECATHKGSRVGS